MAKGIKAGFWCICAPSADLHAELHRKKKVKGEKKLRLKAENGEEKKAFFCGVRAVCLCVSVGRWGVEN